MIAVRNAISRASTHRWLWVLVLLVLVVLLVFLVLHGVEHALEGGDVLLCIAITSVALLLLASEWMSASPVRVNVGRDPPFRLVREVVRSAPAFHALPLRL